MAEGKELKSAFELAMERLQAEDREQGVEKSKPLTEAQKEQIARLRQEAKAKHAELEILFAKERSACQDPEELTKLEERFEIDRRRADSSLESGIARIKRGD